MRLSDGNSALVNVEETRFRGCNFAPQNSSGTSAIVMGNAVILSNLLVGDGSFGLSATGNVTLYAPGTGTTVYVNAAGGATILLPSIAGNATNNVSLRFRVVIEASAAQVTPVTATAAVIRTLNGNFTSLTDTSSGSNQFASVLLESHGIYWYVVSQWGTWATS